MKLHSNPTTLIELLELRACDHADKTAFTFLADGEIEKDSINYYQLAEQAKCVALQLQQTIEPGSRALLLLPSGIDYIVAFFACLYAGVIAVPAYPPKRNRSDTRLQLIAADAGADVILTLNEIIERSSNLQYAPELNNVPWLALDYSADTTAWCCPHVISETLAFLQYTSGSTGQPKGVMVSHKNLLQNLTDLDLGWNHSEQSVMVSWLPLYHDMGLIYGILEPVYKGFSCYLMTPAAFLQQPLRWLKAISHYRGTHTAAPNFAYELCAQCISSEQKAKLDLSSWSMALNGAEPISKKSMLQFSEAFAECGLGADTLTPGYGLAEFTLKVTAVRSIEKAHYLTVDYTALNHNKVVVLPDGQLGQVLVGCGVSETDTSIVIVNPETLTLCQLDEVGEIWLTGDSVAQGYWQRPEETRDTFQAFTHDGQGPYMRTGDLGFLHEGELFITGRFKDVIIIRGLNYYPQDIETAVAHCHPDLKISGSAAFSIEVEGQEQLVVIQEVERQSLKTFNLEEVLGTVRLLLSESFDLQIYALVLLKPASIPKTSSGKIQRRFSRKRFLNNELSVVAQWRRDEIVEPVLKHSNTELNSQASIIQWLLTKLAEKLKLPLGAIDPDQDLAFYGLDSLIAVTLSGELEVWLERNLSPTLFYDYPSISAIASFLGNQSSKVTEFNPVVHDTTVDIAIIGLACRFPEADNPDAFLELLRSGQQVLKDMPLDRPDSVKFYQEDEMHRIRRGGFLNKIADFDASFFQIAPKEAIFMDPQQRLLLEVCWETLEHAGINPQQIAGSRTGVYIGISTADYSRLQVQYGVKPSSYSGSGQAFSIAANRLSYVLDLQGPSVAVDTACSSSLVAVHQAIQSLRSGECDLVLVGGVNLIMSPELSMTFVEAGMLSADAMCKTFAADADGYVRGEGCGMVALKPLPDALQAGDKVLAVIKGSAVNQDGHSNGLNAPNGLAQQQVIKQALTNAAVASAEIDMVETHGTGTALGDPIEINALTDVLMEGRENNQPCILGSVKASIGHLEAAAGIAGLIKTVLSLQQGEIFPQPKFASLNPLLKLEQTPITVAKQGQAYTSKKGRRYAGVSSFGFGGTNAHVILASFEQQAYQDPRETPPKQHLFTLSAKNEAALIQLIRRYQDFLQNNSEIDIACLCYTNHIGRDHFSWRCAMSVETVSQLIEQLQYTLQHKIYNNKPKLTAKIAMLFTGQGSQYLDMGAELYQTQSHFKLLIDQCDELLRPYLDTPLLDILYPKQQADREKLQQTRYLQPALFALEYSLAQLWRLWNIEPDAVAGHSLGEYVAACIAGVFSLEDGLKLVVERGRLMQLLPNNGKMLVVFCGTQQLSTLLLDSGLTVAAMNGPLNTVVSGDAEAIDKLSDKLAVLEIKSHPLNSHHAFHSPLMKPILTEFLAVAKTVHYSAPEIPFCSNVNGGLFVNELPNADYWCRHILQPVKFDENIQALINIACNSFIEIGSQPVLTAMAANITNDSHLLYLASLKKNVSDNKQMLDSLGQLYRQGAMVEWQKMQGDFKPLRLSLPTYPFQRQRYWLDLLPKQHSLEPMLKQDNVQKLFAPLADILDLTVSQREVLGKLNISRFDEVLTEQTNTADCLYLNEWQANFQPLDSNNLISGEYWLLFADQKGIAEKLSKLLQAKGITSVMVYADGLPVNSPMGALSVQTDNDECFDDLFKQLQMSLKRIVFCWALDCTMPQPLSVEAIQRAENMTAIAVLRLLQVLCRQQAINTLSLTLVTQNAVSWAGEAINILQTPLIGLSYTAALEHSDCWTGLIDIDHTEAAINDLLNELSTSNSEPLVAWRQGRRYCPEIVRFKQPSKTVPLSCDVTASYLITGGLGALGLVVAQCLATLGAKHIFLAGRRDLPSDSAAIIIDKLTRQGVTVTLIKTDVTERHQVAALLNRIASYGLPLRGIIHAAGIMENSLLLQQTAKAFSRVTSAKILGAWYLHELTESIKLDFFVCFSSLASVRGLPGLGSYATANAFMDGLMHYRKNLGLPGLSINWGPWGDVGMVETLSTKQQQALQKTGVNMLTSEQGSALLTILLAQDEAQLIAASISEPLLKQPLLQALPSFVETTEQLEASSPTRSAIMTQLMQNENSEQRYQRLNEYVRQQVAKNLGFVTEQFEDDSGFTELGMDSLTAVTLKDEFQKAFGQVLPATLLLNYSSIDTLTEYLYQRFVDIPSQQNCAEEVSELVTNDSNELTEQEMADIIAAKLAASD